MTDKEILERARAMGMDVGDPNAFIRRYREIEKRVPPIEFVKNNAYRQTMRLAYDDYSEGAGE